MKIEAGKYYKTRDGRKVGPMKRGRDGRVSAFWVCDGYPLEGAASEWFEDGSFWPAGHPHCNDRTAARDLIAEWIEEQIGTLAELDVKPGDVVMYAGNDAPPFNNPVTITGKHENGNWYHNGQKWGDRLSLRQSVPWKLISRAAPTPSIDLTAITTPFGLLDKATQDAMIAHGGPYEYYSGEGGWYDTSECDDVPRYAHRVKPGSKRETVTNREMYITPRGCIASNGLMDGARRCTITYDTIDGVIDMATYKVVAK